MEKRKKKSVKSVSIGGTSVYTLRDLSAELGVGERALARYIKSGELRAKKIAGAWIITEDAVGDFFKVS